MLSSQIVNITFNLFLVYFEFIFVKPHGAQKTAAMRPFFLTTYYLLLATKKDGKAVFLYMARIVVMLFDFANDRLGINALSSVVIGKSCLDCLLS